MTVVYNPNKRLESDKWAVDASRKQTGKSRNGYEKRTHCKNGHEFSEANTGKRKNGGRRCLECSRAQWARVRGTKRRSLQSRGPVAACATHAALGYNYRCKGCVKLTALTRDAVRYNLGFVDDGLGYTTAKKDLLGYLITTQEQGVAQDDLNFQVDRLRDLKIIDRLKCESNPDAFFSDEKISNKEAESLCFGCPIMVECFNRMETAAPSEGSMVAGGRVWFDGVLQG